MGRLRGAAAAVVRLRGAVVAGLLAALTGVALVLLALALAMAVLALWRATDALDRINAAYRSWAEYDHAGAHARVARR